MSDDVMKVTTTTEARSRLSQWGRGLFYRDDGRKRTLVSRRVLIGAAVAFALVVGLLLVQNTPESAPSAPAHAAFSPPSDVSGPAALTIPELGARDSGASRVAGQVTPGEKATISGGAQRSRTKFRGPQLVARPRAVKIPPGAMVKAVLVSGASNGPVRAEAVETLSFAGETLIPQGTVPHMAMGQLR